GSVPQIIAPGFDEIRLVTRSKIFHQLRFVERLEEIGAQHPLFPAEELIGIFQQVLKSRVSTLSKRRIDLVTVDHYFRRTGIVPIEYDRTLPLPRLRESGLIDRVFLREALQMRAGGFHCAAIRL